MIIEFEKWFFFWHRIRVRILMKEKLTRQKTHQNSFVLKSAQQKMEAITRAQTQKADRFASVERRVRPIKD